MSCSSRGWRCLSAPPEGRSCWRVPVHGSARAWRARERQSVRNECKARHPSGARFGMQRLLHVCMRLVTRRHPSPRKRAVAHHVCWAVSSALGGSHVHDCDHASCSIQKYRLVSSFGVLHTTLPAQDSCYPPFLSS